MSWQRPSIANKEGLDFRQLHVMGILNVTPDSFYDGGRYLKHSHAVAHAKKMVSEGATIIDVGGASSRPNARHVSEQVEMARIIPVIEALNAEIDVPLCVDTTNLTVMEAAIVAGARMVNTINALQTPGALALVAKSGVCVCLMHMQGVPQTMQHNPQYAQVVEEVLTHLRERAAVCVEAGVSASRIVIDPGFGFGKTLAHNVFLLRDLRRITKLGYPVMVCLSRKSMLGDLIDAPVEERLYASVAAATIAVQSGAMIIRTHDVKPTMDAIKVAMAVTQGG